MKHFTDSDGTIYCAVAYPGALVAEREFPGGGFQKKCVRVDDSSECVYELMKTKIKAVGGSCGLLRFLEECESSRDFCGAFRSKVYKYIFEEMREKK